MVSGDYAKVRDSLRSAPASHYKQTQIAHYWSLLFRLSTSLYSKATESRGSNYTHGLTAIVHFAALHLTHLLLGSVDLSAHTVLYRIPYRTVPSPRKANPDVRKLCGPMITSEHFVSTSGEKGRKRSSTKSAWSRSQTTGCAWSAVGFLERRLGESPPSGSRQRRHSVTRDRHSTVQAQ